MLSGTMFFQRNSTKRAKLFIFVYASLFYFKSEILNKQRKTNTLSIK